MKEITLGASKDVVILFWHSDAGLFDLHLMLSLLLNFISELFRDRIPPRLSASCSQEPRNLIKHKKNVILLFAHSSCTRYAIWISQKWHI
ncbi:hypothetical protein EYC84_006597 [Monilinia fructicola]|uniref:Uncharacterized protein n=1 Tax=Monilinia fructicola TaxID=38448 RepID=A0A5M9K3Y0_MONFR|nr:hypothetical protein EYC84_006597 [Monilinia fructicola]